MRILRPLVMLLCVLVPIRAWGQAAQKQRGATPSFSGTVLRVVDGSFVIVDKQGNPTQIAVTSATTYLIRKNPAACGDVVRFGMNVKATLAPDGSALQVTASGLTSSLNSSQLQAFLDASDDEWAVLKPKIDRVKALVNTLGRSGSNNGNSGGNAPPSPVEQAGTGLKSTYFDSGLTPLTLSASLSELRRARARAQAELDAARKDLISVVTPRQEALLVIVGVLD